MTNTILLLSTIVLALVLFGLRSALLHMARDTARCYALLQEQTGLASVDEQSGLPKKIKHGNSLPLFKAMDSSREHFITSESLIGQSTIVIFIAKDEYERWPLDSLLFYFRSWWYHIDGNINVFLLDSDYLKSEDFPHKPISDEDVGKYLVLGSAIKSDVVRSMGLTKTPCVVELDAEGTVRRIGFFGDDV